MQKSVTRILLDYAEKNGSVLTGPDALRLGADRALLGRLVADRIILRRHPGVYVLAARADDHAIQVRAALAASRRSVTPATGTRLSAAGNLGAVASHQSAAWLQGLIERPPVKPELTVCGERRRLRDVTVHKAEILPAFRRFHEVPCTLPARTVVDLAARLTPPAVADAIDRGLAAGIMRPSDLEDEIARSAGRRGVAQMRRHLETYGAVPASVLEGRMARLLHEAGVEGVTAQHRVFDGRYRLDYALPGPRVAIEVYGYLWHHSPDQMAHDQARQRELVLAGWRVLVFTWHDVVHEPDRVVEQISQAALIRA